MRCLRRSRKSRTAASLVRDEKGSLSLWFPILLVGLLVCSVWVLETGKILSNLVDLQTAADAASLAGASTADAYPIKEYEVETGEDGLPVKIVEKIVGWETVITKEKADPEAEKLFAPNTTLPVGQENWGSETLGDRYHVVLKGINLPSPISRLLGGPVHLGSQSTSQAYIISGKEEKGGA